MSEEEKWGEDDIWDEGGFADIPEATPKVKISFNVLNRRDTETRLNVLIQNCVDLFQISTDEADILLIHFSWDYDKLQSQWFTKEAKLRAECGIPAVPAKTKIDAQCPVCFDDIDEHNSAYLKCNHAFCKNCWQGHLAAELDKGVAAILAKCPFHKCKLRVGPSYFKKFLTKEQYTKYEKFWLTAFVDNSKTLKWCPNPGCNCVIETVLSTHIEVTCECGFVFCFACENEGHLPVNCDSYKKWKEKNASESENATWIVVNTKPCPKCKRPIEKNQGCNHMTCSQCRYEFCWICMGDWKAHNGNYSCNKINKDLWNKQSNAKIELERYMFYFERYENHKKAIKKAKELRDVLEDFAYHMNTINRIDMADLKFLFNCLDSLINVRRVLGNSYIFGYYLQDTKQVQLFEFMQRDLEMTCELFHEMIERHKNEFVTSDDNNNTAFLDYKSKLINISNVTTKFYQGFITGLANEIKA
jgi:ariadne-1